MRLGDILYPARWNDSASRHETACTMIAAHDQDDLASLEPPSGPSDEAIRWFARRSSGEMSEREHLEFAAWSRRSPANEQAFAEICRLWDKPELMEAVGTLVRRGASSRAEAQRRSWSWATAAAAALIVISAAAYQLDIILWVEADHITKPGERQTITLADRSTVTLNTSSAIASETRQDSRRVRLLKGEALFKVQPDPTRPFLVEHGPLVARAVGTAFVVREQRDTLSVSVVEGIVSVESPGASSVAITAGQRATVNAAGVSVETVGMEVSLA